MPRRTSSQSTVFAHSWRTDSRPIQSWSNFIEAKLRVPVVDAGRARALLAQLIPPLTPAPKHRWYERKIGGSSIAEQSGMMLLIFGEANAVGASDWAKKIGYTGHIMAWGVFLAMFGLGWWILFWSMHCDRRLR